MAALTDEQKQFLIVRLACYASPGKLRTEFKERFKIDVSASQICYYNPLTAQGAAELDAQWKTLFHATRKRFQEEVASIPIADKWYRLLRLQEIIDDPDMSKSSKTVMKALENAAKEEGNAFTNRSVVEDASRQPQQAVLDWKRLDTSELNMVQALVAKATVPNRNSDGTQPSQPG